LGCAYGVLAGFLEAEPAAFSVFGLFDNEEVGSTTKQGACSTFLSDTLKRAADCLGANRQSYLAALAGSVLVSADNAHAVHPNHPELSDPHGGVYLGKGLVVKHNANQKYTTDAVSSALFCTLCRQENIPLQHFSNRSDLPGGSTLGNLSNTQVSVNAVDIGLPQLAMHSCYETGGTADVDFLVRAMRAFYSTPFTCTADGSIRFSS
ncbi:MAG: M18 family aminopeptidase, partial [Pygmaiobacter sp.]